MSDLPRWSLLRFFGPIRGYWALRHGHVLDLDLRDGGMCDLWCGDVLWGWFNDVCELCGRHVSISLRI